MKSARLTLLAGAIAAALAVVGCGSSDNGMTSKPAAEIVSASGAAVQSAGSVHVTARSSVGNSQSKLEALLARGQARVRLSLYRMSVEVIRTGSTIYLKGNQVFNRQLERGLGVKIPSGVWLKGSASSKLAQIGVLTDIKRELPALLAGSGALTKGARKKIDGQSAIEVRQKRKLSSATLYVATAGQPYPIELKKIGRETGQTTFSDWNEPVDVVPPANAVEIDRLQH